MATECDRFCWQELNVDLNNLVSGPLDAILTQPESYEIKLREKKTPQRKVCLKQIVSGPVWLFNPLSRNWLLSL